MITVSRIVKQKNRTEDLSGMGAFREGGRWNSKGEYMLYMSENSSLAILENLVHFEIDFAPPSLYLMTISIGAAASLIYTLPDKDYPESWLEIGNLANRAIGDTFLEDKKYIALKIRSCINTNEYNYLLNPLFPRFHELVKVTRVEELRLDGRLVKH